MKVGALPVALLVLIALLVAYLYFVFSLKDFVIPLIVFGIIGYGLGFVIQTLVDKFSGHAASVSQNVRPLRAHARLGGGFRCLA